MRRRHRAWLLVGAVTLSTGACKKGPDYTPPPVAEFQQFRDSITTPESIANLTWWELFADTTLQGLIATAVAENRDVRIALARIAEARAQAGFVRADLYPRVDIAGGVSATEAFNSDGTQVPVRDAFLAADVFYEVDLWGRISRSNEAAAQELMASEEAYRSITLTLVSDLGSLYLLLRDLDTRLDISQETYQTRLDAVAILQARFDAGVITEVDVNQAQIELADAEAAVEVFKRLRTQTENALSVLMGHTPEEIRRGLPLTQQTMPPEIPVGLPADLVRRRPDILEAERRLAAQTARIGVAEALKFPQLSLTGSAGLSDDFTSGGLTSAILNIGANLFGPLFNAGRNQRRVDIEVARTEQLLNRYEQTILTAFQEVEDAVVAVYTYRAEHESRVRQVEAARNATELSWARYQGGITSYLEVLDLQRSLFGAELAASETLQRELSSTVELYKALGGGWPVRDSLWAVADSLP
ncbi:MAG: efflux transporter outer membrane subunit [Gemmatimonadetes bacterium]|nr:efflux transporter outer membrane subunit [Gemmatimonadota bacterium]